MFTENEIATFIEDQDIQRITHELKKQFTKEVAQFLEISEHDFLSVVLLAPSIGVALADKKLSIWEELRLNRKARRYSKGGFFLAKDPVVHCMRYLIKHFEEWEIRFYATAKAVMDRVIERNQVSRSVLDGKDGTKGNFVSDVMNTPYIIVRFIASFFLDDGEDIFSPRRISQVELDKIKHIGQELHLSHTNLFKEFCAAFQVK